MRLLKIIFFSLLVVSIFLDVRSGLYVESWLFAPLKDSVLLIDNWKTTSDVVADGGIAVPNFLGLSWDGLALIIKMINSLLIFFIAFRFFLGRCPIPRGVWWFLATPFSIFNISMILMNVIDPVMTGSLIYLCSAIGIFYIMYNKDGGIFHVSEASSK